MKDHVRSIVQLIEEYGVKRFAEVGVYQGRIISEVTENIGEQIEEYWAIDRWAVYEGGLIVSEKRWEIYYRRICELMLTIPQLRVLRLDSHEAANLFSDGRLDMVYIDADHSYDAVVRDIIAWGPKVCSGGILGGHDYDNPDVRQAVKGLVGEDALIPLPHRSNTWATVI
jgi:hypothetical protein